MYVIYVYILLYASMGIITLHFLSLYIIIIDCRCMQSSGKQHTKTEVSVSTGQFQSCNSHTDRYTRR